MIVWKNKITYWLVLGIALFITAELVTEAAFWITGRGGSAPCGEDRWRWGLTYMYVGLPAWLLNYITGLVLFIVLRARIRFSALLASTLCLQFFVALAVLVILQWPNVIYRAPLCE